MRGFFGRIPKPNKMTLRMKEAERKMCENSWVLGTPLLEGNLSHAVSLLLLFHTRAAQSSGAWAGAHGVRAGSGDREIECVMERDHCFALSPCPLQLEITNELKHLE